MTYTQLRAAMHLALRMSRVTLARQYHARLCAMVAGWSNAKALRARRERL